MKLYMYPTGCFRKSGPFCFCTLLKKKYRAQNKLYNNLEIVLPVHKCVFLNGITIPKVLRSLFWAL